MADRKNRSTLDSLLVAPTVADKKIRAAILEWVKTAVHDLGGWRRLTAVQRSMLISAKLSLTILLVSEKTMVDVESPSDPLLIQAAKNAIVHANLLRKTVQALNVVSKARPRAERGVTVAEINEEYRRKKERR
jgi:hypothetical protein